MKVLHILGTGRPGGVESFVLQLVRDTSSDDAQFTVCIAGVDGIVTPQLKAAGASVTILADQGVTSVGRATAFARLVATGGFDVIHGNSGGRLLRFLSGTGGARVISHLHGLEEDWLPDVESRGAGLREKVRALGTGADEIAVSSRWMQQLLEAGGCAKRIAVLGYGVDITRFSPGERARLGRGARRRLGIDDGARVVGFVGRLERQKGPTHLVDLARTLANEPDIVLAIVGDGSERASIETGLRGAALSNVRVSGETTDVPALMAAFDVTVMPSRWEPFGIVALESAAMGIPVVAFDVGGISEAVIDGETGLLVPPRNTSALSGAVLDLLHDRERRVSLGAAGRARVERDFRASVASARVLDHYRELLA